MFYPNLKFPRVKNRPFFYTNFVQTVDGKVAVKKEGYWPIGSKLDYQVLTELRANSDCLIHGGVLGKQFGSITKNSLEKEEFKNIRVKLGKQPELPYYIVTKSSPALRSHLEGVRTNGVTIYNGNLKQLVSELNKKGYKNVLVEGGPTLLGAFLKENLIDEIFLTISPKIFGTEEGKTLTLVEGYLFPKNSTKNLSLISFKKARNELFLRYKVV